MEKERKPSTRRIIIAGISAIVLIAVLGISFAYWAYSRTTDNQILVAGDIYMKYTEQTLGLSIPNAMPSNGPDESKHFDFTIEGRNKYPKPIWYEIVLSQGEEDASKTRLKDEFLRFRLVEIKGEERKVVVDNASYSDLREGQKIWVNTIDAKTDNIEIKYELYMWIAFETKIGNTEGNDYTIEEWNNVYASIKVNVSGDFNEKEIEKEIQYGIGTDVVKDTIGQTGGVIGVKADNTPTTNKDDEVREYRYSGNDGIKNYIYFNCESGATEEDASSKCELWRILGVFKDENGKEHLKIVRDNVLSADMFPEEYKIGTITYDIQYNYGDREHYDFGDYAYLNRVFGTDDKDWTTAGLQYWLNTEKDETEGEANKGYLSYLKGDTLSMIEETKYYLGTTTYEGSPTYEIIDTPKEAYINERDVESCVENTGKSETESGCKVWSGNQATWEGKVALLYPSDYGFSASSEYWETKLGTNSFGDVSNTSWLQKTANHDYEEWFLSPSSCSSVIITSWSVDGYVNYRNMGNSSGVRPSLYLKSNIKIIGGDGSKLKPYFYQGIKIIMVPR